MSNNEIECEECAGKGWNWEYQQVAERKSDVQEFKIDCEVCDGTGIFKIEGQP